MPRTSRGSQVRRGSGCRAALRQQPLQPKQLRIRFFMVLDSRMLSAVPGGMPMVMTPPTLPVARRGFEHQAERLQPGPVAEIGRCDASSDGRIAAGRGPAGTGKPWRRQASGSGNGHTEIVHIVHDVLPGRQRLAAFQVVQIFELAWAPGPRQDDAGLRVTHRRICGVTTSTSSSVPSSRSATASCFLRTTGSVEPMAASIMPWSSAISSEPFGGAMWRSLVAR